jgi:DNA-binding NarL/FixJ family response regulator
MSTVATKTPTKQILLIDDDDMIRILFKEMFWIYSANITEVTAVRSIADAYEYLKNNAASPDVVVLGLALLTKSVDGTASRETQPSLDLIANLKAKNANVKVVVFSHHKEEHLKEAAARAGADHYIIKGEQTPKEVVDFIENL